MAFKQPRDVLDEPTPVLELEGKGSHDSFHVAAVNCCPEDSYVVWNLRSNH